MTNLLDTLVQEHLTFDIKMSQEAFGGYAPTAPVLATRAFALEEERMYAVLREVSSFWWAERASEHRGVTFQIGNKVHTGRDYDYECERVRDFLREAGFKTLLRKRNDEKGTASALFVTLDPKIGEEAVSIHPQYLTILREKGAKVPDWAKGA